MQCSANSRTARRLAARNADRLRSQLLAVPRRTGRSLPVCASARKQVKALEKCHALGVFVTL